MTLKLSTNILQHIAYKSSTVTYYESSILFELFCVEIFKSSSDLDLWSNDLETFHKYSSAYCLQIFNVTLHKSSIVFELFCVEFFKSGCDLDVWSINLEILHKYLSADCLQIFNSNILWKFCSFWAILCWNFQIELWPWLLVRWPWNFRQIFFSRLPRNLLQ